MPPRIPADVVGQVGSTAATATQNAASLTQSPQAHWYDVWSQTGSGLASHSTDPQYLATHLVPGAGVIDSRIRMLQAMARPWGHTGWDGLRDGMSQQAGAVADQASQLWNGTLPDGTSMTALQRVGAAFGLLGSIEQLVTMPLGAIPFPAFPAIRVMDMDIGLPHAHMHPPNLTPPNPVPVPLPSTGPIIPIPFVSGASKTLINNMPAARCGDMGLGVWCGGYFPMYEVFLGSANVWIEGNRAGRVGVDITKHCIFSSPKPNDPPLGPMFGTTINCSPNVMIGGIPLPSLTSMAIGAAFKALFKGLGRIVGAVRKRANRAFRRPLADAAESADSAIARSPGRTPGVGPDIARVYPQACQLVEDLLHNGKLMLGGDQAFQEAVERELRKIACTNTGRQVLEEIGSSPHSVHIEPWNPGQRGNTATPHGSGAYTPGVGSDSTVRFNPDPNCGRYTPNSPPDTSLAHELGHGRNNALGNNARHVTTPPGFNEGQWSNMEEFNNINNVDNPYREEWGLPTRTGHNMKP